MTPRQELKIKARSTAREIADKLDGRDACINCGEGPYVEVHHIDGDPFNNHPMNLAPLCYRCHKRVHRMERTSDRLESWREDFKQLCSD